MARTIRQSKILEIVTNYEIETQEDLVSRLNLANFKVTQATISRDIKELGLTKILTESGKYKYAQVEGGDQKVSGKILNMFRESVISITPAENLIVIKTLSGSANAAALSVDKLQSQHILGCIAGDDTLLIVCQTKESVKPVMDRLNAIID